MEAEEFNQKKLELLELEKQGLYQEALQYLEDLHRQYPEHQAELPEAESLRQKASLVEGYKQAMSAIKADKKFDAIEILADIIEINPDHEDTSAQLSALIKEIGVMEKLKTLESLTRHNSELQSKFVEIELENSDLKKQAIQITQENKSLLNELNRSTNKEIRRLKKYIASESIESDYLEDCEFGFYRSTHQLAEFKKRSRNANIRFCVACGAALFLLTLPFTSYGKTEFCGRSAEVQSKIQKSL